MLVFSTYLARFWSLCVWFLHTVVLNSCNVLQNWFIESCTSLIWVNRYLYIFSTFLAQFVSNSVYDFSVQCSRTCMISIKLVCRKLYFNADKTKYMIMSRDQNAGRSHNTKTDNSSIERVEEFKYLGTMLTHQNSIQEKITSRLNLGNPCYYRIFSNLIRTLFTVSVALSFFQNPALDRESNPHLIF